MTTPLRDFLNKNTHAVTKWTNELNSTTPPSQIRLKSIVASANSKREEFANKREKCMNADNSSQQDYDDAEDMMDKCNDIVSLAESLMTTAPVSSVTTTGITPAVKPISVALPKIKIDCFSGDLSSFDQFWNLFVNCVDNNPSIVDCAKFSYLLSYLRGEPAELLSGLHVDSTNYSTAKDLLLKRYVDKRRLSQQYIDSFLTLPCCDGSTCSLRTFHTKLVTATRNLANNGIDIDDFSLMLSSKILEKLPDMLRIKIVESFPDDKWLVSQIITSLDKHVNIVEACNFDSSFENKSNTSE